MSCGRERENLRRAVAVDEASARTTTCTEKGQRERRGEVDILAEEDEEGVVYDLYETLDTQTN